ncbi:MAG: hypothetical protein V3V25_01400 [Paracoccaceae bacterium]
MTDNNAFEQIDLDALLEQESKVVVQPSEQLMSRIIQDADHTADQLNSTLIRRTTPDTGGFWRRILLGLGGWPTFAGLTTATLAGIWIGYASPDSVSTLSSGLIISDASYELADFMPVFSDFQEEG